MHNLSKALIRLFIILNGLLVVISCTLNYPVPIEKDTFILKGSKGSQRLVLPLYHTVVSGDTLYSIAFRYGTTVEDLSNKNHINQPYLLRVNQRIYLKGDAPRKSIITTSASKQGPSVIPKAKSNNANITRPKDAPKNSPAKQQSHAPTRKVIKALPPAVKKNQAKTLAPTQWRWPAKGRVTARFGSNNGLSQGIDIAGNIGESIVAARDGVVVYAGSGLRGYGKLLIVKHDDIFLSAYAHNHRLLVQEGASVKAGQKIAEMGSSDTDRPKLHFEIRRNGKPVNPENFLP